MGHTVIRVQLCDESANVPFHSPISVVSVATPGNGRGNGDVWSGGARADGGGDHHDEEDEEEYEEDFLANARAEADGIMERIRRESRKRLDRSVDRLSEPRYYIS